MADLNHKAFNVAFGSVAAAYSTLVDQTTGAKSGIKHLSVYNTLDVGITISFDATTDHYSIPAAKELHLNWDNLGKIGPKVISVKRLAGAPASGAVTGGVSS